jgi:hypothetical protein
VNVIGNNAVGVPLITPVAVLKLKPVNAVKLGLIEYVTPPDPAVPKLIYGLIGVITAPVAKVIGPLYDKPVGAVPGGKISMVKVAFAVPADEPEAVMVTELELAAAP